MVETSRSRQVIVNLAYHSTRRRLFSLTATGLTFLHRTKTGSIPMLNFKRVEQRITFGVLTLGCTATVSLVSAGSIALYFLVDAFACCRKKYRSTASLSRSGSHAQRQTEVARWMNARRAFHQRSDELDHGVFGRAIAPLEEGASYHGCFHQR